MNRRMTRQVAQQIAHQLQQSNGGVVYLHGGMGAGKTTLVGEIVKILCPSAIPSSPTFTLINQYTENIYHADLYRLWENGGADNADMAAQVMESTGIADLCVDGNYVFIEWPEGLKFGAARNIIDITIKVKENGDREFVIA